MGDPIGLFSRQRRAARVAVVAYGLGLLALYVWSSPRDAGLSDADLWRAAAGNALLMWAGTAGVSVTFREAGRDRPPRRQRGAARRALTSEQRRAVIVAIRRRDPAPPGPGAIDYARARQVLAAVGGVVLLVAAPVGRSASIIPTTVGGTIVAVAVVTSLVGAALVLRGEWSRQALSRWTDPPAHAVAALDLDDAYRTPDWPRWRRDSGVVQGLAVAALLVYIAGISGCVVLHADPANGVVTLAVAGVVVAIEFALTTAGWFLARPHRATAAETRRFAALPLAARVDLVRDWRRGRAGDRRYADAALARARSSAPDLAVAATGLAVMVALSLAFTTPLLVQRIPALLYPGLAVALGVLTALLLRQSRRQQRVAEQLREQARASAEARRQRLVVIPRSEPSGEPA